MSDSHPEPASLPADDGSALAELLRMILRDVAHEMRGPVQSVVVNLEVLRRRAAAGKTEDVLGRADVIEEEVRRLHGLADAFLGLVREPAAEPVTLSVEKLLAGADPIIDVVARSGRVRLVREPLPLNVLIRVRPEPATLAVVRLCVGALQAAGESGVVRIAGHAESDAFVIEIEPGTEGQAGIRTSHLTRAASAIETWLVLAGGTATLDVGSDTRHATALIRLQRAT